jgi:hypothetical protein
MRSCPLNAVVRSLHSPLFSPAGLLLRGASLVSGTPGSSVPLVAQTLGVVYLFLHIGFYFVAPVLCLAAWIMAGLMRIAPGR